jgi:Flp pilus assembly protein TadD
MQEGNLEDAFRYLKKGIETDPEVAGLWVNLGVLYSQNENYSMAIDAYRQALSIQPSNKSALANLASTLQRTGRSEEARYYSERVTYYRNRNPYYHYHLAQAAYQEDRLDDAMTHLDDATELKKDEHQFYFLRGLIYEKTKNYELAARSYEKARDTAEKAELVAGYTERLQALESSLR